MQEDCINYAKNALVNVLEVIDGEKIVIFCDKSREKIGWYFACAGIDIGCWVRLVMLSDGEIRSSVPSNVKEIINSSSVDLYINVLRGIAEETPFRIMLTKMETRRRVRLAHCPGITEDMFTMGAMSLSDEEYKRMQFFAQHLISRLNGAVEVEVVSPSGTNIRFSVKKRDFFTDTKINWKTLKWLNLPVGEVIVAPVETSMNGVLVCTTAVGGIGRVKRVRLVVKNGKVVEIDGDEKEKIERIRKALNIDEMASYAGEFAFGINPKARVVDEFLETEKVYGTCHIAFGNNLDFPGGRNWSKNHMDFLIDKPTVRVRMGNGDVYEVMVDGRYADIDWKNG
ncbi:MAG: hypothetical protein DRN20_03775 [Thermoplasmata archaeon]|nr:MAG: hypothetical protein DRN20_03775 [Thermoplasmata archaeon]